MTSTFEKLVTDFEKLAKEAEANFAKFTEDARSRFDTFAADVLAKAEELDAKNKKREDAKQKEPEDPKRYLQKGDVIVDREMINFWLPSYLDKTFTKNLTVVDIGEHGLLCWSNDMVPVAIRAKNSAVGPSITGLKHLGIELATGKKAYFA